ncbi:hypothetical protein HUW51_19795 [Adhaeribacter swui]|uniref:Outer membrane protein assembly factor BamE n=1 Tax=Adhaeribacter swui TaxID=2086471 RepID=A0A7G7GCH2_9BACT|nr:hypothetical protein [Adhaeribacter swui]QNF34856.1 hypothetical protein HUW51_19795 [Adhaeribacter swui]
MIFLLSQVITISCRTKKTIPDFDSQAWKNDAFACQDIRSKMVPKLKIIRRDLRGLTIRELMDVLGKPDLETLLAGNQRIYHYYLFPGDQCQNKRKMSSANKLTVRFNALEQVSEVLFEQPLP